MSRIAVAFSGGKESIRLVRMYKKHKPLLLTYLPNDDTRGLRALFRYFAKKEGLKIKFLYGDSHEFAEEFSYNESLGIVLRYSNPLLKLAKTLKVKTLIMGRRQSDFPDLLRLFPKNFRKYSDEEIEVLFPLWRK